MPIVNYNVINVQFFVNNDITALKIAEERPHFVRAVIGYCASGNIAIHSKLNINTLLKSIHK